MMIDLTERERQEAGEYWEPWGSDTALAMAARMAAARVLGGTWEGLIESDDDEVNGPRGDVRITAGPAAGRWVRLEIAPPDGRMEVSALATEIQASIIVLVYPSNETWGDNGELPPALDFRAWCTREHWRNARRMADGYWFLDWERMDPIVSLLRRLGIDETIPDLGIVPIRAQPSRTTATARERSATVSKAQADQLANEKPKRDYRQYARLAPTGELCPKGCGDVLDGAARTCWTCNTGHCDLCRDSKTGERVPTGSPLLGRCVPCNMTHQEEALANVKQRTTGPEHDRSGTGQRGRRRKRQADAQQGQAASDGSAEAGGSHPERRPTRAVFGEKPAAEYKPTKARKGAQ